MSLRVDAIILAAGCASRMGVPKVLLPAGRGHTLLSRVLHTALNAVDGQVIVVLGREVALCSAEVKRFLQIYPEYKARAIIKENPDYAQGLSTSLRVGVQEVTKLEPNRGAVVFLADQPAFTERQAHDLLRKFRERRTDTVAVAAAQNGKQRNPVVFSAALLPELLEVTGDKGAREVLERYEDRVARLELGSGPWAVDADDWPTYAQLMRKCGWLEEVTLPIFTGEPTAELVRSVETHLAYEPRPLLASGVLLVGLDAEQTFELPVRLGQTALQTLNEQDIQTLILGNGATPEAYLRLLRRAALWTLQR